MLTVANVKYAKFLFLVYDKFVLILADSLWIFYSYLVQSVGSVNQRREHRALAATRIAYRDYQVPVLEFGHFIYDILSYPFQNLNQVAEIALHFLYLFFIQI